MEMGRAFSDTHCHTHHSVIRFQARLPVKKAVERPLLSPVFMRLLHHNDWCADKMPG